MRPILVSFLFFVLTAGAAVQGGAILTPLDPAMVDETLHSINSARPVIIEFVNHSSGPVDIYWIDFGGVRKPYRESLPVGERWQIATFVTHPWLVVASQSGGTTARGSGHRIAGFEVAASGGTTDPTVVNTALISGAPPSAGTIVDRFPSPRLRPVLNPLDQQKYVWIPPGRFRMGCTPGEGECDGSEGLPHSEEVAPGFWLSETEVTQAAYEHVTGKNPSAHKGARLPVENVTWNEAADYCGAIKGRLPSQEEWEYAARGGAQGFHSGNLEASAWVAGNSAGETHTVAGREPNAFGLYDMLGNVWEWTAGFDTSSGAAAIRGGSRSSEARGVRPSSRMMVEPLSRSDDRGFRCALNAGVLQGIADAGQTAARAGVPGPGEIDQISTGLPYPVYPQARGMAPKLLWQIQPEYSEKARKAKIAGSVVLRIVVDPSGKVARAVVVRSLGFGLDEKAIEAVLRWKFAAAEKDGKPVAVIATVEVNFHLQ